MIYRREIDGLRALAVVPVILFHAGFSLFGGGFVGVDVFFVISGYLITSLILAEREQGDFTIRRFYERRARRILPALFLVMIVSVPLAWLWLPPADLRRFGQSLIAVPLFVSNMLFARQSGYFDAAVELKPLLHTWSLAVEEQYYLLFPPLLLLLSRLKRGWTLAILSLAGVMSLAAAQWGSQHNPSVSFFLLGTRGWELLIGALAAFYLAARDMPVEPTEAVGVRVQALSWLGLLLILVAVLRFDRQTPFPSLYALVPTVGAVLIILFATPRTRVGALLASRPLVGMGLISYSAYLWHQPLFAFARHALEEPGQWLLGALAAASVALAYASWRWVERPFRDRARVSRRMLVVSGLLASAFFIALGVAMLRTEGFKDDYVQRRLTPQQRGIYATIQKHTAGEVYADMGDDGQCNFWSRSVTPGFERRFADCSARYGKALVVLGDSHAMNIYNAFFRAGFGPFMVGVSQGGCRPHDNQPYCHYDGFDRFLQANADRIARVVYHQSGSYLLDDFAGRVGTAEVFRKGAVYSVRHDTIAKIEAYLNGMASKVDVVWLGPFAEARVNFSNVKAFERGFHIDGHVLAVFDDLEQALQRQLHQDRPRFRYLPLTNVLVIDSAFLWTDNCLTYRDTDHFSVCGERIVGERIRKAYGPQLIAGPAPPGG